MEIAIVGQPQSGKSTIFEIMTGVAPGYGEATARGIATVPDARFDRLVEIFQPKKVTPATVPFIDTHAAGESAWETIRQAVAAADGLVHVVDAFTASDAAEAIAHYRALADELVIADLMVVERRLEKIAKLPANALKPEEAKQAAILPRCREALEAGTALRDAGLPVDEVTALKSFAFWTLRPELVVVNTGEEAGALAQAFAAEAGIGSPVVGICAQVEQEIAQLPAEERAPFLESLGIEQPAFERIIETAFRQLGRMVYFTVGEDEVRAWVIPAGSTAPRAAAAIHKDFERGFIRAEVVSYDDFIANGATLAGAKAAGKMRLEGKEYVVANGDIISFRFNV